MKKELLRKLPKIDELLKNEVVIGTLKSTSRNQAVEILRETIDSYRENILQDRIDDFSEEQILKDYISSLRIKSRPKLRKVINAAGIVVHTNLGRSILSRAAIDNVINVAENYSNLEYDVEQGQRGSRYSHIEDIIKKITGAEAAMVVNNNAAAVMLVLDTLCRGKEAIVSRGQLVEIGGSFRVPDVMAFSGAKLVEVGTTNRTHLYDYENNINENTGVLLKVHTSNFKILGFTEEVNKEELVKLGASKGIPVVEDIGSGVLVDFQKYGFVYEPTVQDSIKKGVDVVTFSGDKMLGGPQAGIIAGRKSYIDRMKKNQLTRALRIDKLTLAALEGTLKLYLDEEQAVKEIPTLNMILSGKDIHKKRAYRLKKKLGVLGPDFNISVKEDFSIVGGGSMPEERLHTYVIGIKNSKISPVSMESALRKNDVPIIVRVVNNEVVMDMRTLFDRDFDIIVEAFRIIGEKHK